MNVEEALEAEHCSACGRNCPLSDPLCGAGKAMADDLVFELTGERPNRDASETHFDHSGRYEDIGEWHPHGDRRRHGDWHHGRRGRHGGGHPHRHQ